MSENRVIEHLVAVEIAENKTSVVENAEDLGINRAGEMENSSGSVGVNDKSGSMAIGVIENQLLLNSIGSSSLVKDEKRDDAGAEKIKETEKFEEDSCLEGVPAVRTELPVLKNNANRNPLEEVEEEEDEEEDELLFDEEDEEEEEDYQKEEEDDEELVSIEKSVINKDPQRLEVDPELPADSLVFLIEQLEPGRQFVLIDSTTHRVAYRLQHEDFDAESIEATIHSNGELVVSYEFRSSDEVWTQELVFQLLENIDFPNVEVYHSDGILEIRSGLIPIPEEKSFPASGEGSND